MRWRIRYLNGLITGAILGLILAGSLKPKRQSFHQLKDVEMKKPRQLRARVRRVADKVTEGVSDLLRKNR